VKIGFFLSELVYQDIIEILRDSLLENEEDFKSFFSILFLIKFAQRKKRRIFLFNKHKILSFFFYLLLPLFF
jgi:hypothetical protein